MAIVDYLSILFVWPWIFKQVSCTILPNLHTLTGHVYSAGKQELLLERGVGEMKDFGSVGHVLKIGKPINRSLKLSLILADTYEY